MNFDRLGRITRVDLRLRPGVDIDALRKRLQALLPAGLAVERPEASVAAGESLSRSYRVNLNVLALVALFTGGLLVFSTQALAVVRRRSQLRAVARSRHDAPAIGDAARAGRRDGRHRRQRARLGRRIHPGAGRGADHRCRSRRGILSRRRAGARRPLRFRWRSSSASACSSRCSRASFPRSRRRGRLPHPRSRRATKSARSRGLRPSWPGFVTLGAGAVAALLPPVAGLPLFGYVAIALLLIGTLMLMPRIAVLVLAVLAAAARRAAAAGAVAAARRAGTGRGEPCGDRRRREPDGVDGDHGRVVPDFARRVARARSAGRCLRARGCSRRYRLHDRRRSGADRRAARRAPRRVPARAATAARSHQAARRSARAHASTRRICRGSFSW